MKRYLLLIWFILLGVVLRAQVVLTGKIVDVSDNKPISNVIVSLNDGKGVMRKFAQTGIDGIFTLSVSVTTAHECKIQFSLLSYKRQSYPLTGENQDFYIRLEPTSVQIKEVIIKAHRIGEQGDTLVYNVASFANEQDRSIGDVLKKMPGIDVNKEGKISYNGVDINKFYIEGKDLLEGRYGIATRGISYKDVGRVEVMENHQPIKVMQGFTFSDQAGINLKLKDKAKAKWIGNWDAKGGYSEEDGGLWNVNLFGMLMKGSVQNITTLKSNNTGENIKRDIRNFYSGDLSNGNNNQIGMGSYIRLNTSGMIGLDEERTLMNRSHLFSSSQLWQIGKDFQLKAQVDYLNNREEGNKGIETSYFLPDGTKVISENQQSRSRQNMLVARAVFETNEDRCYIQNTLHANLQWNDIDLITSGTYPNSQVASQPLYMIMNDFKWMQRFGKRLITISSNNQFHSYPQYLNVSQGDKQLYQSSDVKTFYTNENACYNWAFGRFVLSLQGGLAGLLRTMESCLSGLSNVSEKTSNDIVTNYLRLYASPELKYIISDLKISLEVPLSYYHYYFQGYSSNKEDMLISPTLHILWDITPRIQFATSGRLSQQPYDIGNHFDGWILTDYRSLTQGYDTYATSIGKSLSGGFYYKHTMQEFFANLTVLRSWNSIPFQSGQRFMGDFILRSYQKHPTSSDSWLVIGAISKSVNLIKGIVSLNAAYSSSNMSLFTEDELVAYRSTSGNISADVNGQLCNWLDWYYQLNYGLSALKSSLTDTETLDNWQHTFRLHIVPAKKVLLTLSGEYYRNEVSRNLYKDLFMANAKITYKWKDFEFSGYANNLFNKKEYSYNIHNELTSISCRQQIRSREFLVGVSWRR